MTLNDDWLADRLLPGERIVWSGYPGQGLLFTKQDILLIPFSLAWCGFTIFWEISVTRTGGPGFMSAWGGMFVAVGLYFVLGRFLLDALIRRHMHYAITDRRLLIERGWPFRNFTAAKLDQLPQAELSDRPNGYGTIRFGPRVSSNISNIRAMTPSLDETLQLLAIPNARAVFDLLAS